MRRLALIALRFLAGTACGLGIGMVLAVSLPVLAGHRPFTVMSGSMEPAIHTGDVVVDSRIPPTAMRVGDVVTFRDPEGSKRLITHRVRSLNVQAGRVDVVTKGDANNRVERWTVPTGGEVGRVEYRVWKLGYALALVHSREGMLALVAVPAVLLCILELVSIWRPARPREEHAH